MSIAAGGELELINTAPEDFHTICAMERDEDTSPYIIHCPMDEHLRDFRRDEIVYKSVFAGGNSMVGFVILKLDPDGVSVELARIVIAEKGRSYGSRAVALVDIVCREELHRSRIWLDVFEFNHRAQRVYEKNGYTHFGEASHKGKTLRLYEKNISARHSQQIQE